MGSRYCDFMQKPQRLHARIAHKADEVAFKLEICQKATGCIGERVQTSPSNVTEIHYAEYIDANNRLQKLITEYNSAVTEVTDFLYDNLDFKYADILEWRYIGDKSLTDISLILGIAYSTTRLRMSTAEKLAKAKFYEIDTENNNNATQETAISHDSL